MFDSTLFGKHLEEGEKVSLIVHRHWIFGVRTLVAPIISLLLSVAVLSSAQVAAVFYTVSCWCLLSILWCVRNFFDYYMDAWIITDQAIIDLEWKGWFHRQSSRILYSDVQGVSYEIQGVLGTIMRFGNLTMEKISTGAAVSLKQVFLPRRVEALILKNMEEYLHKKNMKNSKHVQEILAGMVAEQIQLGQFTPKTAPEAKLESAAANAAPKKSKGFSSSKLGSKRS